MNPIIYVAIFLISAVVFLFVGYILRKKVAESKIKNAETEAQRILDEAKSKLDNAKKEAENAKKEELVKAKEEIIKRKSDLDDEIKERRSEIHGKSDFCMHHDFFDYMCPDGISALRIHCPLARCGRRSV